MIILGIETSCDETAVAIIEADAKDNLQPIKILVSEISSQVALHAPYGGVVPRIAKFAHEEQLPLLIDQALTAAKVTWEQVNLLAVTTGPGLAPALSVGFNYGRQQAEQRNIPLVGVNHIEGHIYSPWLDADTANKLNQLAWPILILVISGGHTQLVLMTGFGDYQILGRTLDDAVGESFDKVAKMLGLGYPGGPAVSQAARQGQISAFHFPRPLMRELNYDFSYAGLKTSVLYTLRGQNTGRINDGAVKEYSQNYINDICASFEAAAIEVLVTKTVRAITAFQPRAVTVVGGVSANQYLRQQLISAAPETVPLIFPALAWTGDNAAMIAVAGWQRFLSQKYLPLAQVDIKARWPISEIF